MTRSRLENKYLESRSLTDRDILKKQKNYCNRLYKKERRNYYNNIDIKVITDTKKFWGTIKPFLIDKGMSKNRISLIEGNKKIIVDDTEVAEILNTYFGHAASSLGINEPNKSINDGENLRDPIDSILLKFSKHPSILMINAISKISTFSFSEVELLEIKNEINSLNIKKSNPPNSISPKHLKEHINICNDFLHQIINFCIKNAKFDDGMVLYKILKRAIWRVSYPN